VPIFDQLKVPLNVRGIGMRERVPGNSRNDPHVVSDGQETVDDLRAAEFITPQDIGGIQIT